MVVCVCVCVCVRARVCVYVSVRLYPFTVEGSSVCNDVIDKLECTDQQSCVLGIILDASAKFLHLSFTSKDETPASQQTGEKME